MQTQDLGASMHRKGGGGRNPKTASGGGRKGKVATEHCVQKAHQKLESLKWDVPCTNWTWDKFIQQHQDAHNDLVENNEPIPETAR